MLHGAGIFTNIHHDFPTKLGHFWGRYVGKSSSTMVRIWGQGRGWNRTDDGIGGAPVLIDD